MVVASIAACAHNITTRRSTLSAYAPATNDKKMIGRHAAVCSEAIKVGASLIDIMNQATPTPCIIPETFESSDAAQNAVKAGMRSGAKGDAAEPVGGCGEAESAALTAFA